MPEELLHNYDTEPKTVEELASELSELDPKPITHFTPDNIEETIGDFLSGKTRNPDNATYSKLDSLDFDAKSAQYQAVLEEIKAHPGIPRKHHHVYESYISRSQNILELMRAASQYRKAVSEEERDKARETFKDLNRELYGEPEPSIAAAMASEIADDSAEITEPTITRIREEFLSLLPVSLRTSEESEKPELKPSDEVRETIDRAVNLMYSPLLNHAEHLMQVQADDEGVDLDKLKVTAQGMAVIFQEIIDKEFPESGWRTLLTDANAINVDSSTKTVKIPENRASASPNKVRGLVVHELGVHMLRSIIGEKADLVPLRFGLSGVGEAEEGIAKVMESALTDDASRTGYQHYLTAAILGQGKDFRDTFEIMWRYRVLDAYLDKPKSEVDAEYIDKQKELAFKFMFRSIRGTNELPWHTTLNYFNGTRKI